MRPTHQRLDALDGARRHRDLGLIDESQAIVGDGGAQIRDQGEPPSMLLVRAGSIGCHASTGVIRILQSDLHAAQ